MVYSVSAGYTVRGDNMEARYKYCFHVALSYVRQRVVSNGIVTMDLVKYMK
jgi:hypothetical protein